MDVKSVKIIRRIPLEQYGYVEIEAYAEGVETIEDVAEAVSKLQKSMEASQEVTEDPPPKTRKSAKGKKADDETEEEETEETEEETEEEEIDDETEEEDDTSKKPGKKFKKKSATYSRSNEVHKKLFSEELTKINPKWNKTDAGKTTAKSLSKKMDGTEFLDDDGKVLAAFKSAMKKGMK